MNTQLNEPMHVAFCVDDNFCQHLAALIVTLQAHSSGPIHAHVISNGLSDKNINALTKMATAQFVFSFHTVTERNFANLPISEQFGDRINQTTYYRIGLAEILPETIDRVLYIDADVVALDDIRPLWNTPLKAAIVAAVADGVLSQEQRWQELGLQYRHYFNAGVLLINLQRWRVQKITHQTFSYFELKTNWKYNDQDLLNLALNDKVKLLDTAWNMQTFHFRQKCSQSAKLVHFTESEKPWHISSNHPHRDTYLAARRSSPYQHMKLQVYLDKFDQQLVNKIAMKVCDNNHVVIYGCGQKGRRIYHALKQLKPELLVVAFIDKHQRGHYEQVRITNELPQEPFDFVIVSSNAFEHEIAQQLRRWLVPNRKVIQLSPAAVQPADCVLSD